MSTQKIVRIGFRYDGSYQQFEAIIPAMVAQLREVPGLLWKIWTHDDDARRGAGLYLFADEASARAYLAWILPQMEQMVRELDPEVLDFHAAATEGTFGPVGPRYEGREARRLAEEAAREFSLMGVDVRVRASAEDTGGAVSVLEQTVAPGGGSPLHTVRADKLLRALEGELSVTVGDTVRVARAGDSVFIPAGVAHRFVNRGAQPARLHMLLTPGGHEGFLYELAQVSRGGRPQPAAMRAVCERHGVVIME